MKNIVRIGTACAALVIAVVTSAQAQEQESSFKRFMHRTGAVVSQTTSKVLGNAPGAPGGQAALAHRYFLCHILDGCVFEHLQLVGHRRNVEAAHSEALALNPRTASASRRDMLEVMDEVGHLFKHMVEHIAQIERPMLDEIWLYIKHRPHMPPADAFARIPARPPQSAIDAARAAAKSRPANVAPESGAT